MKKYTSAVRSTKKFFFIKKYVRYYYVNKNTPQL